MRRFARIYFQEHAVREHIYFRLSFALRSLAHKGIKGRKQKTVVAIANALKCNLTITTLQ